MLYTSALDVFEGREKLKPFKDLHCVHDSARILLACLDLFMKKAVIYKQAVKSLGGET